jgi:hypothetical protein
MAKPNAAPKQGDLQLTSQAKQRPPRSVHDEERHHLNDLLADCHALALRALAHDDSS